MTRYYLAADGEYGPADRLRFFDDPLPTDFDFWNSSERLRWLDTVERLAVLVAAKAALHQLPGANPGLTAAIARNEEDLADMEGDGAIRSIRHGIRRLRWDLDRVREIFATNEENGRRAGLEIDVKLDRLMADVEALPGNTVTDGLRESIHEVADALRGLIW